MIRRRICRCPDGAWSSLPRGLMAVPHSASAAADPGAITALTSEPDGDGVLVHLAEPAAPTPTTS